MRDTRRGREWGKDTTHYLFLVEVPRAVGGGEGGGASLAVPGDVAVLGGAADGQGVDAVGVAVAVTAVLLPPSVPRSPHKDGAQTTTTLEIIQYIQTNRKERRRKKTTTDPFIHSFIHSLMPWTTTNKKRTKSHSIFNRNSNYRGANSLQGSFQKGPIKNAEYCTSQRLGWSLSKLKRANSNAEQKGTLWQQLIVINHPTSQPLKWNNFHPRAALLYWVEPSLSALIKPSYAPPTPPSDSSHCGNYLSSQCQWFQSALWNMSWILLLYNKSQCKLDGCVYSWSANVRAWGVICMLIILLTCSFNISDTFPCI